MGIKNNFFILFLFFTDWYFILSRMSLIIYKNSQTDKDNPKIIIAGPSNRKAIPIIIKIKIIKNFPSLSKIDCIAFNFQFKLILIPLKYIAGIINGRKTNLKYGDPTDISFPVVTSTNNGQSVPNKIVAAEAHKKTLLRRRPPSFDIRWNDLLFSIFSYLKAYKINEKKVTRKRKLKINTPLAGSEAKAWTEVSKPDRTIKVPNKVSEKAIIDSNIVHDFKLFRFSVTLFECKRAVDNSQGSKEIFSTGSQNHQPPHPSS